MKTFHVGGKPVRIVADPLSKTLYITNVASNTITVVNERSGKILKNISVRNAPTALALDQDTGMLYVTNSENNTLSVIDTKSDKIVDTVHVGIAVDQINSKVYLFSISSGSILMY